jgi:hypothetical protein
MSHRHFLCDWVRQLRGAVGVGMGVAGGFLTQAQATEVVLVLGAAGEKAFAEPLIEQAAQWQAAAQAAGARVTEIGRGGEPTPGAPTDQERLQAALGSLASGPGSDPVWLVLTGHGTWDGKTARFNLRGPDVTPDDLAAWLKPVTRPMVLIHAFSCSGPFLPVLAGPQRIILTATRSGSESNFSRFGSRLAQALNAPKTDVDGDGATSVLELFLHAAQSTAGFYQEEGRLLTEHALIDDTGDGRGTPADWFRGLRATKTPKEAKSADGWRAGQVALRPSAVEAALTPERRAQIQALEAQLGVLREAKSTLTEEIYYERLESLLHQLAALWAPK